MSVFQPVFSLGNVSSIPARSAWDLTATLYLPSATSNAVAYAAVIANDDVVRFRLFSGDDTTALLTATNATPSTNGTTVTIDTRGVVATTPAAVTIKLSATDTDRAVGSYEFLLDVQDISDGSRWQPACRGTIAIESGPA